MLLSKRFFIIIETLVTEVYSSKKEEENLLVLIGELTILHQQIQKIEQLPSHKAFLQNCELLIQEIEEDYGNQNKLKTVI